jgi:hypothetical protein
MSMKTLLAAALAATAFTGLSAAQDFSMDPTFGEVSLDPGFAPDPYQVTLIAGGTIDASGLGEGCAGMIANAPDFRVNYGAGGAQLYASVSSAVDTTLVINGPDGSWFCNDDSPLGGLDPLVGGEGPLAGQYDIWVGTYGDEPAEAVLSITEYTPG